MDQVDWGYFPKFFKEINILYLTYGLLQVHKWNNDSIIERMDRCNLCCEITDFFQYIYAWNQG